MSSIKVKIIITAIITIIIAVLIWLFTPEERTPETPSKANTLYVQSSLLGECRAIITPILDDVKSAPSEIPCKMLRSKK
ncbi:hypothetical protein HZI34_23135 [Serratia fonticola]|uniref:hypothetical protein n=1 Tax=Serratia fonticola TaxID=47917 RepID=UPI0015C61469|nr:hypothetical protein [Serratia fonticola]NYA41212.1 hypothetical protein [Serratia fonticola]